MIDLDTLLKICVDKSIKLSLHGENLKINAAQGLMTPDLAKALKYHKQALIERLKQRQSNQVASLSISNLHECAPVSFAQKRFWMLHSISPDSSAYHIPGSFALSGDLLIDKLVMAFQHVAERHDILRTVYIENSGVLSQSVCDDKELNVDLIDLTNIQDVNVLKEAVDAHKGQVFTTPFDLAIDFPLRARIIRLPDKYFEVLLCVHHIAADAWSIPLFLKALESEYECLCQHVTLDRHTVPQYIDFAIWQQEKAQQGVYEQQLKYWQHQLKDIPQVHELVTDFPRSVKSLGAMGLVEQRLPKELLEKLTLIAQAHKTTVFTVFHSLLALFIFRWCGQKHIVVGSPNTGRHLKELEPMLGCFINSIVINNEIDCDWTFAALINRVSETVNRAMQHQELPFEHLVEALPVNRQLSINPVFQIMLALQQGGESQDKFYDLQLQSSEATHSEAKVDLTLNVVTSKQGITLSWQYAKSLFERSTIESMAETFLLLVNQVIIDDSKLISDYALTNHQLIEPVLDHSTPALLPQQYYQFLQENPHRVVLIDQNQQWTGNQTLFFIRQVQAYCLENGIVSGDRIMLLLDKSVQTYALIYALWGLGITYIPVSAVLPDDRIRQMAEQVQPKAFISDNSAIASIPLAIKLQIDVSEFTQLSVSRELIANTTPADIAYILFTSGTTGCPKGVCVSHRQLAYFIDALVDELPQTPLKLAIDSPLIFDASLASIGLISRGYCLFAVPESAKTNTKQLIELLELHAIDLMFLSTSFLEVLMFDEVFFEQSSVSFKFGGEACSQKLWDKVTQYCQKNEKLAINAYGPTETTVTISCAKVMPGEVHIGKPLLPNIFRVVDPFGHLCPLKMPGELEIKGPQVSLGYVDKSLEDNHRFVRNNNDFSCYKTGDFVVKLADGNFRFIGRRDNQVKLNGYRIELAEIEAVALRTHLISQIVAKIVTHNEQQFLAVFYVGEIEKEAFKKLCNTYLPRYMQPHIFEERLSLPLTPNGKIDKGQLSIVSEHTKTNVALPDEGLIAEIGDLWRENLPHCTLSADSDFFSIGGHSLVAIGVIHQINNKYGITAPVSTLFEYTVLSVFVDEIAKLIAENPAEDLLKELEDLDESTLSALLEEL